MPSYVLYYKVMHCTNTVCCCICKIVISDYTQNSEVHNVHLLLLYLTMHWLRVTPIRQTDRNYLHCTCIENIYWRCNKVKMCDSSIILTYSRAVEMPWPENLQKDVELSSYHLFTAVMPFTNYINTTVYVKFTPVTHMQHSMIWLYTTQK